MSPERIQLARHPNEGIGGNPELLTLPNDYTYNPCRNVCLTAVSHCPEAAV